MVHYMKASYQVAHYVRNRVLTPFGAAKLHREARPSYPKDEKMKKETYMEPGGSGQCACAQLLKSTIIHKHCAFSSFVDFGAVARSATQCVPSSRRSLGRGAPSDPPTYVS